MNNFNASNGELLLGFALIVFAVVLAFFAVVYPSDPLEAAIHAFK